jgi:hypothetical protein
MPFRGLMMWLNIIFVMRVRVFLGRDMTAWVT